jgi:hypothetical protein
MTTLDYLLIGHVTADLKAHQRVLGGTVSYSALVARSFGRQAGILTSCAFCEPIIGKLSAQIPLINVIAKETSTFENVYEGKQRWQTLHERADTLTMGHVPIAWSHAPLVHLAPVADEIDASLFSGFANATVMLTPQGLMRQWDKKGRVSFKHWCDPALLKHVHLVVFSKQDIQAMPAIEDDYIAHSQHLIVTDGANGGTYYHQGKAHHYMAFPAQEKDPTGAGDVFATAVLASLPRVNGDILRAIEIARRLAAISVEQVGVVTFTPQQIETIIQESKS